MLRSRPARSGKPSSVVVDRHQAQPVGRGRAGGPGSGRRRAAATSRRRRCPGPGRPPPGSPPASAPSGGRRTGPRCRSAAVARRRPSPPGPRSPGQRGVVDPADDRLVGRGPRRAAAEGPEVVLADQGVGGGGHGPQVERVGHVPGRGASRGSGPVRPDQVAVAAGGGRAPGVEAGRGQLGRPDHHGRGRAGGSRARRQARPGRTSGRRRSTWTTWPRACTPASVRPAQARARRLAQGRRARAAARSPATVRRPGWAAKPWKPLPS